MTQYVQLRDSDISSDILSREFLDNHPITPAVVSHLANTLMREWFPRAQPMGEDLENWIDIAKTDALLVIRSLVSIGLLSDIDSAKVSITTNDERK
jgi:hypothetical protein